MPFKKALQVKYIEEKTLKFLGNNKILVNNKQKKGNIIDVVTIINNLWKDGISLPQDGSEDEK